VGEDGELNREISFGLNVLEVQDVLGGVTDRFTISSDGGGLPNTGTFD